LAFIREQGNTMLAKRIAFAVVTAGFVVAAQVHAQAPGGADPADLRARVPELKYDSVFAGFRAAKDAKPEPWKRVNEEIASPGGQAGHLKALEKDEATARPRPEAPRPTHKH